MQGDLVSPARERLGYKPRDDDDVPQKRPINISFCPAIVSLILLFFLYLSFPSCPSKNTPCAADLKTNTSDIKQ